MHLGPNAQMRLLRLRGMGSRQVVPRQATLTSPNQAVCTGVEDDGWPRGLSSPDLEGSLTTLHAMAQEVHASDQVPAVRGPSHLYCIPTLSPLLQWQQQHQDLTSLYAVPGLSQPKKPQQHPKTKKTSLPLPTAHERSGTRATGLKSGPQLSSGVSRAGGCALCQPAASAWGEDPLLLHQSQSLQQAGHRPINSIARG